MTIYAQDAIDALADIRAAGAAVVFPGAGTAPTYDATTSQWSGGEAGSAVTGYALQLEGDPVRLASLNLVLINPVTLLVAAYGLSVTPAPNMSMTWAGTTYVIRDVQVLAPDGTAITYTVVGST